VTSPFSLIVTDPSPLLTLVLADSLDVLLRPHLPITIPDAVYFEATRVRGAPGADGIVDWINAHRLVPTEIGIDQQRRLEEGRSIRGLGELAAIEALDRFIRTSPDATALLLFDDCDIGRRAVIDDRVALISTGDFLRELERAGLIQSADHILDLASERGRNVERQRTAVGDEAARAGLREQLRDHD
jgi:predicted nucleic acid-binding protein